MADPLRLAPLDGTADRGARLAVLPPATRVVFRSRPAGQAVAATAFGASLPQLACTSVRAGARSALWLGPDEYLLLAPLDEAEILMTALRSALATEPHALVDVSHRQIGVEVSGYGASRLLQSGCPLDLSLTTFPPGMCTRSILGKAEIVLWRTATDRFHLEIGRSFSAYIWQLLELDLRNAAALEALTGT